MENLLLSPLPVPKTKATIAVRTDLPADLK